MLASMGGTILENRYELGRLLGSGGMGAVFKARHLRLDRIVAIKVLRPALAGEEDYTRRFLREARAVSKVRHRNVVELLDYGEAAGGLVYSVMEYLKGSDLDQLLRAQINRRMPWSRAHGLLLQITNGLRAAHECGVIHRDIKPANCFIAEEDGNPLVKLVDFGIAKLSDSEHTQQLTGTAEVLGTPSYIAPELVRTRMSAGPWSDIYSVGVLAYRMLTGTLPFTAETSFEVLRRSCFDPVPPPSLHVPDIPPSVEAFIVELLAKTPDQRPADMSAVRARLLELGPETLEPAPRGRWPSNPGIGSSSDPTVRRTTPQTWGVPYHPSTPSGLPGSPIEVHESTFATPKTGETLSSLGDATLPSTPSPEGPEPIRSASARTVLGGVATLALTGVAALWVAVGEPWEFATTESESHGSNLVELGTVSTLVPEGTGSSSTGAEQPQMEETNAEIVILEDPEFESSKEIVANIDPEVQPPPKVSRPNRSKKVQRSDPTSDASIRKRLERELRTQCSRLLSGRALTLSFVVNPEGRIYGVATTLQGEAGQCAKRQLGGTKFQPRTTTTPFKIKIH